MYEKIHFLGEDPDRKVGESEEQGLPGQRKKTSYASLVPMMYNHTQHHVSGKNEHGFQNTQIKVSNKMHL